MKHRSIEERFQVERWNAPIEMVNIANQRTRDMAMAYMYRGARADELGPLAESCYMQGINDAVDSLLKAGYKIVRAE